MTDAFHYSRPDLAQTYADALLGKGPFGFRSGLFLAAPRRTGKSTFLRQDLVPALQDSGVRTIYVDLWSDRQADPGALLGDALADELRDLDPAFRKLLRGSGLNQVSVGGVRLNLAALGKGEGATLTEALRAIADKSGQPVALIVDEAQHALASDAGVSAMFALKAARDALNEEGGEIRLMLVFTGSHRDKLSALVMSRKQPFFGADVIDFPLLGDGYVRAYVAWLNERLARANQFDTDDVIAAFELLGSRPELLQQVLKDFAFGLSGAAGLRDTVQHRAEVLRDRLWAQFDSDFGGLSDLQRVVLETLADDAGFSPFAGKTLESVSEALGRTVTTSDMQSALDALRDKELVWKSGRGMYALEDQGIAGWLRARA